MSGPQLWPGHFALCLPTSLVPGSWLCLKIGCLKDLMVFYHFPDLPIKLAIRGGIRHAQSCPHVVFSWDRLNVRFNEFKRVGPQTSGRGLSQRFEMTWWSSQDSLGIPGSRQDRWKMWLGESRNGKRIARWALYVGWPRLLTASWCPWWFCSSCQLPSGAVKWGC